MTPEIDRIMVVLDKHRWKSMGVSSVECECGEILYGGGDEPLTQFPADEAFRRHVAEHVSRPATTTVGRPTMSEQTEIVPLRQRPSEAAIQAAYDQRGDYDHRPFETFKQDTIAAWLRLYRPAQHPPETQDIVAALFADPAAVVTEAQVRAVAERYVRDLELARLRGYEQAVDALRSRPGEPS